MVSLKKRINWRARKDHKDNARKPEAEKEEMNFRCFHTHSFMFENSVQRYCFFLILPKNKLMQIEKYNTHNILIYLYLDKQQNRETDAGKKKDLQV